MYQSNDEWIKDCHRHIGPGWHRLVENLHNAILNIEANYQIVQIKSKLGGLRFYIDYANINDEKSMLMIKLIQKAEAESYGICEECGNKRKPNPKGASLMPRSSWCEACRGVV